MTYVLQEMPRAQAKVCVFDADHIELISYQTIVAAIHGDWLYVYGLHSATTRRHIGAFVREYIGIDYQVAKYLCEKKMKYHIFTGEVVPI